MMPPGADPCNELVGSWKLESWTITYSDGREATYPFGPDAVGTLIYSPERMMSATISRASRPRMSNENVRKAPAKEKVEAFDSFFHYTGRWRVEGDHVIHSVSESLNPNFAGTDQARRMIRDGDRLTLVAETATPGGATMRNALHWRRAGA